MLVMECVTLVTKSEEGVSPKLNFLSLIDFIQDEVNWLHGNGLKCIKHKSIPFF